MQSLFASALSLAAPMLATMPGTIPPKLLESPSLWQRMHQDFPGLMQDQFIRSNAIQTCDWWRMFNRSEGKTYQTYLKSTYMANASLQELGAYPDYLKLHELIHARFCPDVF
jgi:hypothetical protein